ncbi:hypothetical protein F2Q69_00011529 [Brassica cretica]|uniref:Uncharacterized protein n=1 Tax=Brassica cretica TaxID=69181 RepID=A0A8S9R3K3_BRACR|nr:hypothetical protein F2Q69_00011529 [Brassica cretica]
MLLTSTILVFFTLDQAVDRTTNFTVILITTKGDTGKMLDGYRRRVLIRVLRLSGDIEEEVITTAADLTGDDSSPLPPEEDLGRGGDSYLPIILLMFQLIHRSLVVLVMEFYRLNQLFRTVVTSKKRL